MTKAMLNLRKKAFTLIELLVVIAIIGILATLAVVALQQARQNARDSKRLADAKQMHTAIELFYNENNRYPTTAEWESGEIKSVSSGNSFMQIIPSAPRVADGGCSENQNFYIYQPQNNEREYKLSFCLGKGSGDLNPGPKCLTPGGLLDQDCNIEGGVIAGGGSGGGTTQPTGGCLEDDAGCIWQTHGPVALSDWACSSNLDVYNGEIYTSYRDGSDSRYLKMAKLDGSQSSWTNIGGILHDQGGGKSSMQVFNGVPYISYKDYRNSDKIITKRFTSGSWETLGDYTSSDIACHPSLAVYANIPYVAYKESALNEEVYVVRFIHGAWEQVGPSVSNGQKGTKPILRIYNGELHVMYRRDCDVSTPKWVVKKFDGTSWNQFGNPIEILHPDKSGHADFYIGTNGDMYVAYQGGNSDQTSQRGVVAKYNGTDWEPLGPNGGVFSDWHAGQIALYVYQGTPYVAYKNGDSYLNPNQSKRGIVEVKRYNGSAWESVGPLASYEKIYSNISILIDNNIIYLLYLESSSPENNFNDSLVVRKLIPGVLTCSSFDYSAWSVCSQGQQARTVLYSRPVGCSGGEPILTQACLHSLLYSPSTGGTVTGNTNQSVGYGESGSEVVAVANSGYFFSQWSDGVTTANRVDSNVQENISVSTQFTANTYSLNFDGQGGTFSPSSKLVTYNQAIGELPVPTKSGYSFRGWNTQADGEGVNYFSNTIFSVVGNLTVYAAWVPTCGDFTFTYKGNNVTYGTVLKNGLCWFDRDLGANQICTAYNDSNCYGDLFQWGRSADGHQIVTSNTTSVLSPSDNPGHSNFIFGSNTTYDWRDPQNVNLWQGTYGTNNPCPSGWRVPTRNELITEVDGWVISTDRRIDAYKSNLRWATRGSRSMAAVTNGRLEDVGEWGFVWSSVIEGTRSAFLFWMDSYAGASGSASGRASGFSVRCVKNN